MEYCNPEEVLKVLERFAFGYLPKDSEFFINGNSCLPKINKHGVVRDFDEIQYENKSRGEGDTQSFNCNIPGCIRTFKDTKTYEKHYNSLHRFGCSICNKNLPSAHLLDLHIQESHDSFFAAQAERKPMYSCFIEECETKSSDPKERRDHCIKVHKFPHDFRFDKVSSQKKNSNKTVEAMETDSSSEASSVTPVQVPKAFHFGHSTTKTFHRPKKSVLDQDSMLDDLKESLSQC